MYLGGLNIDDRETPPCCPVILAGSESDKRDEIIDRVGWLKESFDRYSRINRFMNNSVGHLCRELGGGVSPETTIKEYAQLGDPSWLPSGL
jgi:hypothetical protein